MADQVYLGTIFVNNDPDTGGLKAGDVVQLDSTLDNAVLKVVGANSASVIGVVIVGGSKGSQVTICGFTGQRIRLNIDGAATVNRGDQLVSDGTIAGHCKVDNAATADEVFAVAIAAKISGIGSQVEALYLAPAVSNATGSGASANGYYLVSRSTNAPVNAVNLGALTSGFLKATITSGVAVITTDTSTGAPETSKYILQQPDGSLPNAQALSALTTGLLKNTTTTGVLTTAIINTDFPSVAATYVVASSVAAPPNAVNLGALTSGLLKQTVVSGVSTVAIAIPGTDYLTSASLSYQTISNAGTVLPQHVRLNFDGTVLATESTSLPQTNVGLPVMSGLTPGSYFLANIIVDPYGRVIAAVSTTSIDAATIVSAPNGIAFFSADGFLTDDPTNASWSASTHTATFANLAVRSLASSLVKTNGSGLLQNAADGTDYLSPTTGVPSSRTLTATAPILIDGTTSANLSANRTISLATSGVTPGSYTNTNITVDSFGRITAASTGSGGGGGSIVSVSGTAGNISSTGGTTPVINLIATAVTAGSYTYGSFTVDAFGRLTAASSGTAPVTSIVGTSPIFATGSSVVTLTLQGGFVSGGTSTTPQNLGTLTTGLLKGTVTGGISTISTAIAGTDYLVPGNYITALTGDVVATGPGSVAATISNNVVSNAKFRQSAGLSVVANPTGTLGNVQDLTATGTGQVLWDNAGTLVFATLPYSVITGTPTSLPPSGPAGGGLSGTYPNPTVTLAASAVGFGSGSNTLTGDTSRLVWDTTRSRLGVNTGTPITSLTVAQSPTLTIVPNVTSAVGVTQGYGLFVGTGSTLGLTGDVVGFVTSQSVNNTTGKPTLTFSALGRGDSPTTVPRLNIGVGTIGSDLGTSTRWAFDVVNTSFDAWQGFAAAKFNFSSALSTPTAGNSWNQFTFNVSTLAGLDTLITSVPFDAISWRSGQFTATTTLSNTQALGFNYFSIYAPSLAVQSGSTLSITNSATLALSGPPTVVASGGLFGTTTITNAYGFWVQGANTTTSARFDGGVQINGQASTAVQISNFTAGYVKSSGSGFLSVVTTVPATDVTGLFYQTVSEVGSALAQQPILNFDGTVVASNGSGKTNVGLPAQGGLTAASYTYANFTVDAFGRLTVASNGTDFGASGGSHSHGLVPDPGASSGTAKFLREDATWAIPPGSGGVGVTSATPPLFVSGSNLTIQGSIVSGSTSTSAQNLGALTSGLLLQSVTSGVATLAIASPGVDYVSTVSATTPIVNIGTVANPDFAMQGSIVSGSASTTPQNLGSLSAGLLKQSVSSGVATIATAVAGTDYQSAITWPAAGRVLVSSGTSSAPTSDSLFTFDASTHTLSSFKLSVSSTATVGDLTSTGAVTFSAYGGGTGGSLQIDGTGLVSVVPRGQSNASYKFSINFASSSTVFANIQSVVVPGDSGTLATGAGGYNGPGGTSVPAVLAAAMGGSSSPTMYTTMQAYTAVKWAILQQVATVSVANGANVRYSLYMTTDPFTTGAYTLLATFDTGVMNIGSNFNAFFSTFNSLSIGSDVLFFVSAHRTDVVGSSVLTPLQFTSNLEFIV